MTTTTWTSAPAGALGQGGVDVRPYPGVVVCSPVEPPMVSGLPIGAFATEVRGISRVAFARLRPLTADIFAPQQSTQHDDTTLGIHFPGRPQS